MKRNLRIVIGHDTLMGHYLRKSGWFSSHPIRPVPLSLFKPSWTDIDEFDARVSAMLGFGWSARQSGFGERRARGQLEVDTLKASPVWERLADNSVGLWLPCTKTYIDDAGWYRHELRIWFQDETDATLFSMARA